MSRGCCGGSAVTQTQYAPGPGVTFTGTGTIPDPVVIAASGVTFAAVGTDSVDMQIAGPNLSANVRIDPATLAPNPAQAQVTLVAGAAGLSGFVGVAQFQAFWDNAPIIV